MSPMSLASSLRAASTAVRPSQTFARGPSFMLTRLLRSDRSSRRATHSRLTSSAPEDGTAAGAGAAGACGAAGAASADGSNAGVTSDDAPACSQPSPCVPEGASPAATAVHAESADGSVGASASVGRSNKAVFVRSLMCDPFPQ